MDPPARGQTWEVLQGGEPVGAFAEETMSAQRNDSQATTLLDNLAAHPSPTSDRGSRAFSAFSHGASSSSASSTSRKSAESRRTLKSMFSFAKSQDPKPPKPINRAIPLGKYRLGRSCFSAEGNTLYLWETAEPKVVVFPGLEALWNQVSSHEPDRSSSQPSSMVRPSGGPVYFVAGGKKKYMVVSSNNLPNAQIELHWNVRTMDPKKLEIPIQLEDLTRTSFAISRNDRFIAMGTKDELRIWEIVWDAEHNVPTQQSCAFRITPPRPSSSQTVEATSQKTAFSADSKSILVATRYRTGHGGQVAVQALSITGADGQTDLVPHGSGKMSVSTGGSNDCGLTSVFCDNDKRVAVVTIFADGVDNILLGLRQQNPSGQQNSPRHHWTAEDVRGAFSYRVASAAQSPDGKRFAIATSNYKVFTFSLDRTNVRLAQIKGLCPSHMNCSNPSGAISLAYPDEETVYGFWFDSNRIEMYLAKISFEQGEPRWAVHGVRSYFETVREPA